MQLQQAYDCFIKELKNRECATYFPEYFLEDRPLNWLQTLVTCIFSSYIPRQDDCTDTGTSFNSVVAQSLQMYLCNMATCELQNLPLLIKEKGK